MKTIISPERINEGERLFENLTDLIPKNSIKSIVEEFAYMMKIPTGIINTPPSSLIKEFLELFPKGLKKTPYDYGIPSTFNEKKFAIKNWHMSQIKASCEFCNMVRKSKIGMVRCWWADRDAIQKASKGREAILYQCHMGLDSLIAPIFVGGFPLACIYGSQIWTNYDENTLKKQFQNLELENIPHRLSKDDLKRGKFFLSSLAEDISRRATWKATLIILSKITQEIGLSYDLKKGLDCYLSYIKRLINSNSGGIWLIDQSNSQYFFPAALFCNFNPEKARRIVDSDNRILKGKGLVSMIFNESSPILLNTKSEIDKISLCFPSWRKARRLHSFLGVPMRIGKEIIGILEMGSDREYIFCEEDKDLLDIVASHTSLFVRSNEERKAMTTILSKRSKKDVLGEVVRIIPKLVHGEGCSVFLREKPGEGKAILAETTGLHNYSQDRDPIPFYKPNEGLTGWVLEKGNTLALEIHKSVKIREKVVREKYPGATWISKYSEKIEHRYGRKPTRSEFAKRAYLAVPLKTREHLVQGVLRISCREEGNFSLEEVLLVEACASSIAAAVESESSIAYKAEWFRQVVQALAKAVDANDPYTEGHSVRVAIFSRQIGERLKLPDSTLEYLEICGLLHDIGKIGIPSMILSKAGKYNRAEKSMMDQHSPIGYDILSEIEGMEEIAKGVLQHHKFCDGTGYPKDVKVKDLCLFAKIIAVADSFDAMTTDRPYQPIKSKRDAAQEILELGKGDNPKYDPRVVQAAREVFKEILITEKS